MMERKEVVRVRLVDTTEYKPEKSRDGGAYAFWREYAYAGGGAFGKSPTVQAPSLTSARCAGRSETTGRAGATGAESSRR